MTDKQQKKPDKKTTWFGTTSGQEMDRAIFLQPQSTHRALYIVYRNRHKQQTSKRNTATT